jgi:Uma2 family endonuclease
MTIVEPLAPPTRLGPNDNGVVLSPAEYDAIAHWDSAFRYELVNGVLVVSPPAGFGERPPNDYLGHLLWQYGESHAFGSQLNGTAPEQEIPCGPNRRRADRAIWIGFGGSFDPDRDTPTVAVEFVSDRSRDRRRDFVEKRREYAAAGVREYWVIDRFAREMTVFRGDEPPVSIDANGVYRTELLPGFELTLASLLSKAAGRDPHLALRTIP